MSTFEHGYAVVVGVAGYRTRGLPPLPLAVLNDAVDFACTLWNPEICGYRADRVRLLLEEQATAQGIVHELLWLREHCTEQDTAILFFSGHGWQGAGGSYLAVHDAQIEPTCKGMISGDDLASYLQAIPAGRLAVFLDCCYSGGTGEIKGAADEGFLPHINGSGLDERTYERLSTGRGRVLLASSGPGEQSIVLDRDRNSLFTSCLLRGFRGEAGAGSALGIFDLFSFVTGEVGRRSLGRQNPVFKAQVRENFSIALRRSGPAEAPPRTRHSGKKHITSKIEARKIHDIHQEFKS